MDYIPFIKLKQEVVHETSIKSKKLTSAITVASYAQELIGNCDRETVIVFGLGTKSDINFISTVSVGSLNTSIVHPREIFKASIASNCARLIIAHNHPSGDISPSDADHKFTRRICEAGELLGIEVLDHVIVSPTEYYSFAEYGHIKREA